MARAALSKVVTEAIRYLGSVRNYAPTTLDTYQVASDQFVQFLRARDLLVDTGLRCSELCRAHVADVITVDGKTSLALTVKGRGHRMRRRHVPVSAPVAASLHAYLVERGVPNPQSPKQRREEPLLV